MKLNLITVEIPNGHFILIAERSGMAINSGVMTMGNIIDSNYRGEIHVILVNLSENILQIDKYQRIAQMILMPCYTSQDLDIITSLTETERGENGLGSSGN